MNKVNPAEIQEKNEKNLIRLYRNTTMITHLLLM